ncbi:MAG: hypothetical protein JSW08_00515 [archaeon]|nr:MAG: hypothetical protein JSW08_00515 [archaeon]
MVRPFTNLKNYEKELRKVGPNKTLRHSKLRVYQGILEAIDKKYDKTKKKAELLAKKRDIVIKLIFEEKDKINVLKKKKV